MVKACKSPWLSGLRIFPRKPILGDLGCDYCLHQRPELGVRDCHGPVGLRCRCLDVWQRSNHPHPTGDPSDSRGASGEDCTFHQSPEAGITTTASRKRIFWWTLVWPNLWISWIYIHHFHPFSMGKSTISWDIWSHFFIFRKGLFWHFCTGGPSHESQRRSLVHSIFGTLKVLMWSVLLLMMLG